MSTPTPMKVMVTGGTGLVGRAVQRVIKERGDSSNWVFLGSKDGDLCDLAVVKGLFEKHHPTHVLHLAAHVGGLYANMVRRGDRGAGVIFRVIAALPCPEDSSSSCWRRSGAPASRKMGNCFYVSRQSRQAPFGKHTSSWIVDLGFTHTHNTDTHNIHAHTRTQHAR